MAEEKKEQKTERDKCKLGIREKLSEIQTKMNVPKDKHSNYGGYDYRSAESILNEFKKYAREYNSSLLLRDEVVEIAGRVYVKSVATFIDCENGEEISTTGYAREPESKPKMDESQVTGSASSYARKYAMNALFLLDDVKDPDTNEYAQQTGADKKSGGKKEQKANDGKITQGQIKELRKIFEKNKIDEVKAIAGYSAQKIEDLTQQQYGWFRDNQEEARKMFGV